MSTYTATQLIVLKWISWPSAFLSVLGSSSIIYHIVKSRTYYSRNRLLMGVSIFDIMLSLSVSVGGVVADYFQNRRAVCEAQGFFVQFGSAVSYYTGAFNLYLMLLVRNNVPESRMAKSYEPWFHAVCILFPLLTAIACIPLELYNSVVQGCYIHAYPFGCDQTDAYECIRGEHARKYFMAFSGVPHFFIFVTVVASQTELYRSVRRRLRANERYDVTNTGGAPSEAQKSKLQAVASQSFCYVMAFLITLLPPTVFGYIQYYDYDYFINPHFFPFFCILYVVYPAQGALNFLVFIRPQYLTFRHKDHYGRWRAFWEAATVVDMQHGGLSRHQRRSRRGSSDFNRHQQQHRRQSSIMMNKTNTNHTTMATTLGDQHPPSSIKTTTERDLSPSARGASVPTGSANDHEEEDESLAVAKTTNE